MKRTSSWILITILALSSCTQEFNYDPSEEIMSNAENIFGLIDPNQDWRTFTSGTVTVTANADLDDITKVQILTESPFLNDNAKILAEAEAVAGQTVTLSYDAPRGIETLIAACVDSKGLHYIKPFDLNTQQVSFTTAVAKTRGVTRGESDFNASGLTLDADSTKRSLNALRTIFADLANQTQDPYMTNSATKNKLYLWQGSNWENEKLWQLTSTSNAGGSWHVVDGAVVRNTGSIDADEAATLEVIFEKFIPNNKGKNHGNQHDNMTAIREGSAVKLFNGHLTSAGEPIILTPVQMSSTDLKYCELYYYYFNPKSTPAGMTEAEYIKQLPKFKAIPCNYTKTTAGITEAEFFKIHEYLLPYYGDNSLLSSGQCTTDGKVYRIRNGQIYKNTTYYMTYLGGNAYNSDKMSTLYNDNDSRLANQLWQKFTTADGKTLLYNIGAKKFLTGVGSYIATDNYWGTFFTDCLPAVKDMAYEVDELDGGIYHFWYNKTQNQGLGSNIGKHNLRIATNKNIADNGAQLDWYFDEYNGSQNVIKLESLELEGNPVSSTAISESIPQGYRVGFMLRKISNNRPGITMQGFINTSNNGCVWGDGQLNTVINSFPGHFGESESLYSMLVNDTRIATFNANNKTYLAFEDGNDCNYSDMIIEVKGNSTKMFDDVQEVEELPFTMCFEDRPNVADYDMNDVVLRCIRKSPTQLQLTLIATGANDQVYIEGIEGSLLSGTELNDKEVHSLFGVSTETFVNTETAASVIPSVTAVYEVSESTTIPQFLSNIYIRNYSQAGNEIHVPAKGQPPFALIIPGDFDYPTERTSIINAYTAFRTWANNAYNYDAWLDSYDESKIYSNPYNR